MINFADALNQVRRKSRLSGRPVATAEARGIAEGFSDSASARLARAKATQNQEQQIANQNAQFQQDMRFRRDQDMAMRQAAEDALKAQKQSDMQGLALGVGGMVLSPLLEDAGNFLSESIFSAFDGGFW
jgi:hypothetical protein